MLSIPSAVPKNRASKALRRLDKSRSARSGFSMIEMNILSCGIVLAAEPYCLIKWTQPMVMSSMAPMAEAAKGVIMAAI